MNPQQQHAQFQKGYRPVMSTGASMTSSVNVPANQPPQFYEMTSSAGQPNQVSAAGTSMSNQIQTTNMQYQQQMNSNANISSNNQSNQAQAVTSSSSAPMGEARPTDVIGRLRMLSDKQLRDSLHKLFSACVVAVNNQGGRDNGATDVMPTGASASGTADKETTGSGEYSNVAFGQAVEECMSVLDQIETNLQLSIDWSNQLKVLEKFSTPQQTPVVSQDVAGNNGGAVVTNSTTEEVIMNYEVHRHYAEKMRSCIDSFLKQLSTDDLPNTVDSHSESSLNNFAVLPML